MSHAVAQINPTELRAQLKQALGLKLISAESLAQKAALGEGGLATGWSALDGFVARGGFPRGELTLLECREGLGATTLWLEAAAKVTAQGRRAAWMNGDAQLNPVAAAQRGVRLENLFLVDHKSRSRQRLWALQELLSSRLFDLIACDLGDARLPLREGRSLLAQARRSGAAMVFLSRSAHSIPCEIASLVLRFHDEAQMTGAESQIEITRASHRPVPQHLQRRARHVECISGPLDSSFLLALPRARG